MKINNEYVNTNNYVDNFFTEDINNQVNGGSIFSNHVEGVTVSKTENYENTEKYNKHGEHSDNEENVAKESAKTFDISALKESLKNVIGEMDGSDYKRLQQWGMAPDDDTEAIVTVYERIQIQLMTYCEDYNATGLSIDKAKMAKVLGSTAMAEAVSKTSDLEKFTDDTKEYMLKNNLEPTVDNVYMAMHSAGKKEVSAVADESVKAAVCDKLSKEGFELNETNVENALWLVSRNIEVTSKNMVKLSELNQIDELKSKDAHALETLSKNISYSLYAGQSSGNAYITDRYSDASDVDEVIETVNNATDEELAYIAGNNLPLNVANLKNAKFADKSLISEGHITNIVTVEYRQVILEARLVMTQASLFNLKRLGVDINYTEISQMTDNINEERDNLFDLLFSNAEYDATIEEKGMLSATYNMMTSFASLPNAVIGKVYSQEITFSMTQVYTSGTTLKNQYEAAMISYETLGTEVRRDLGDSYTKAFNNVDNLLEEIGMEVNAANERAVRILGYNSMEITMENVTGVREIAAELDYLINNLTPKTALHLIRNGINPLEDNIKDVNENLEVINEEIGKEEENMGKFLWNLEKKGEVTQEEKDNYIELYRIINMISKNDGNVIGRVISEGKECTLKNLYSAYKSKKAGNFDYSLSDEYSVSYVKKSLTTFMENPGAITELMEDGAPKDFTLEKMLDIADEYAAEEDDSYYENEFKKYEDVMRLSKAELEGIVKHLDNQSISNIAAYMELSNAKEFQKKIKQYNEITNIVEEIESQVEGEGDISSLDEKYEQLEEVSKELVEEVKGQSDLSYEKLQGALLMTRTLNLMSANAKKNSYFVPMDIAGEVTNVHLTINHSDESVNNVTISMENQVLGSVTSVFTIKQWAVTGRVVSNKEETVNMINENLGIFTATIENASLKAGEILCYKSSNEALYKYEGRSDENVGTNTYYSVAKAFIGMIKFSLEVK